ncbi:Serum response factor-like protein [Leptotrombidium deliense]|uniref:Serum response factor homolog n=1 Tax=Leptotrombidium deliense TaxID=299467 RepID=A0A443STK4_9ACAR|nr:Serum response factor-like protein [Leptotrombidium deliense]
MQNQVNGDQLNGNKGAFIFDSPEANDIIDGLLSDSNESTSSSEHNGHQLLVPHPNSNGHNLNVHACGEKRKYDEFLDSNNGLENSVDTKKLPQNGKKTKGRVKIKMEFIDNKLRRYTTFSKRKTGIMKKAYELSTLTGTQVMLLVASETGHVYTFATRKLQPMITSEAGKALIQTCLNSPDPHINGLDQRMSATGFEETDLTYSVNEDSEKFLFLQII